MDHYIEIRLRPDPEFKEAMLMSALFAKLHRTLAKAGNGEVGVSFPYAEKLLGDTLRIHGAQPALQRIMDLDWLRGMKDHITVSPMLSVPQNCKHRIVRRRQAKSSLERLYRRSVKNGKMTKDEVERKLAEGIEQRSRCPFVQLVSSSSGQRFRLFIEQGKLLDSSSEGTFSAYGLSGEASVPWF